MKDLSAFLPDVQSLPSFQKAENRSMESASSIPWRPCMTVPTVWAAALLDMASIRSTKMTMLSMFSMIIRRRRMHANPFSKRGSVLQPASKSLPESSRQSHKNRSACVISCARCIGAWKISSLTKANMWPAAFCISMRRSMVHMSFPPARIWAYSKPSAFLKTSGATIVLRNMKAIAGLLMVDIQQTHPAGGAVHIPSHYWIRRSFTMARFPATTQTAEPSKCLAMPVRSKPIPKRSPTSLTI